MDPRSTDEAAQPGLSGGERLRGWLGGLYSKTLGFAGLALLAYFVFVEPPPIWPFTTGGRIYVESPEVYTRERLVNDRYRQDFWLKTQLDALDQSDSLIREYRFSQIDAGAGGDSDSGAATVESEDISVSFQDEFLLRAAIRDKIRQMILENLLDDRHDLTGNSIYGLKFDTAVVAGTNTRRRPYVTVEISTKSLATDPEPKQFLASAIRSGGSAPDDPFSDARTQYDGWRRNLESRLNGYLQQASARRAAETCEPATANADASPAATGADKIGDGQALDGVVAASVEAGDGALLQPAATDWLGGDRDLVLSALRHVMGIEAREVIFAWSAKEETFRQDLQLPVVQVREPWNRFFRIRLRENVTPGGRTATCATRFYIELSPVAVFVYLVQRDALRSFLDSAPPEQLVLIRAVRDFVLDGADGEEGLTLVVLNEISGGDDAGAWKPDANELDFANGLTTEEVVQLRSAPASSVCLVPTASDAPKSGVSAPAGATACLLVGEPYYLLASQYEFIKTVSRSDSYSYAVFPRGDVEGVLTDRTLAADLRPPGEASGWLGLSGMFRTRETGAEPIVVNFAGGPPRGRPREHFDFGWAIVRPGAQRASQVSQLVLVSVPAYLDRLELCVETGWLDRDSNPIGPPPPPCDAADAADEPPTDATGAADPAPPAGPAGGRETRKMTVALPPDFEALDTLVIGGTRRQGPVISELDFPKEMVIHACRDAEILIPGERLWRSTTVTLGGQMADQITVMPDMRGIVASFSPVEVPPSAAPGKDSPEPADLIVWTSEGSVRVPQTVTIAVPGEIEAPCPPRG